MRKTLRFTLTMLLVAMMAIAHGTLVPTVAQTTTAIEQLQVNLWPEFDRPEMLVIYRGTLAAEVPLPAELTLRLPAQVGEPHAVAYNDGGGNLLEAAYSTQSSEEWLEVTLETPTANFQLEFYDGLTRGGELRRYTYVWPGDYAVDQLNLLFLPPPGATAITTEPLLSPVQQDSGASGYAGTLGSVKAGQMTRVTVSYVGGEVASSEPVTLVTGEDSGDNSLVTIAAVAIAVALVIGGALWYTLRSKPQPAQTTPTSRRRAKRSKRTPRSPAVPGSPSPVGYCTNCGRALHADDRFCGRCGTKA